MFADIPINLDKVDKEDIDKEILRTALIAELDAINTYEQMAHLTKDDDLKKILLDVAQEEKTHVGEFQAYLLKKDEEQGKELESGKKEIEELFQEEE